MGPNALRIEELRRYFRTCCADSSAANLNSQSVRMLWTVCASSCVLITVPSEGPAAINMDILTTQVWRINILHTDSSGKAVGASLGQLDGDGVEQSLAFASHKLNPAQQIWSTIEREAYAVIWALNKYRDLIFGSGVTVHCDHNPLQYIRECAANSANFSDGFLHSKSLTSILCIRRGQVMWWPTGCPVSRVNTCIRCSPLLSR